MLDAQAGVRICTAGRDPESEIRRRWRSYLDKVAEGLSELESTGVPVLFRPLHEMNGDAFWWSGQDPDAFQRVWRDMFAYLTRIKGPEEPSLGVFAGRQPRSTRRLLPSLDYVDIVGLDAYDDDPLNPDIRAGYTSWRGTTAGDPCQSQRSRVHGRPVDGDARRGPATLTFGAYLPRRP